LIRSIVSWDIGRFSFLSNGDPGAMWARVKVMSATKNMVGMIRRRRRMVYWSIGGPDGPPDERFGLFASVYRGTVRTVRGRTRMGAFSSYRMNVAGPASRPARR